MGTASTRARSRRHSPQFDLASRIGSRRRPGPARERALPRPAPIDPLEEVEAAVPEHLEDSLRVSVLSRLLQLVCLVYGAALVYWIWLAKDLTLSILLRDPFFYGYSLLVTLYCVSRFALAPFYRPAPDRGLRPTASIVIPAFNEQECIEATIDACYAADYPVDRLQVVVVDDGSTDQTWQRILSARVRHPTLLCLRFERNRGKRAAMAEGIRRSSGEICVFVDSDSVVRADGLQAIMADFEDGRVGGVVGQADVLNKTENWLTRMQQVRYYVAFRVIKGSESLFGAVTCASGCFSAYRRSILLNVLPQWETQRFLGRKATYGDDRALTNAVLRDHRIVYQARARSYTLAPTTMRQFLVQQLRWKKSWLRESLRVVRFIWRKHPVAAALTYMSVFFPWLAPIVLIHSLWWRTLAAGSPWFYLMGAYAMALLYSLYYAIARRSPLWWHGLSFVAVYMAILVWQTYYAVATLGNTAWGTRASVHADDSTPVIVAPPAPVRE
ncbi:MAG TPA: glycosyltransferase [Gaiellaceae bacterium]|nr:glycosyltransferase [Gaiellaceae bacterium]